jgi:hypothetical protein
MVMQLGPSRPKFALRATHRRGTFRLGVSHREVPSAWSAPQKDVDAVVDRGRSRKGKRRR